MVTKRNNEMKNRYYILIALLTMTFASCNEDTFYDGPCKVRFVAEVQDEVSVTRATEGYSDLTNQTPAFDAELFISYETTVGTPTAPGYTVSWNGSALSTSLALETGDYNFYGYAPKQNDASFDNSNKTLTILNIPGLSDKDMLVIKPCSTNIAPDDISSGKKTVSLQMDHLMAKITPYFYINSEYNKLRDIHIKSVTFRLEDAKTYTSNVAYNDDKMSYQSSWQANANLIDKTVPLFTDNSNTKTFLTTSSTSAQSYGQCYIVPSQNGQDITNLKMTVTYDVYDKQQQLVRSNETATNKVVVKVGGTAQTTLEAGKNYKLNIQIIPTYLYVLSDNDESSVLVIPNN